MAVSTVLLPPTVTTGVTTRIYDVMPPLNVFNVSVGQIYYFAESRTGDDSIKWENDDKTGSRAGDTYWRISERWGCVMAGAIRYPSG